MALAVNVKMNVVVVIISVDDAVAIARVCVLNFGPGQQTNERIPPFAHTKNIYILLYYSSHLEWWNGSLCA